MSTRSWVPALLAGAVALVVGLVLGGLGPRSEVRELRDKVFDLERQAARRAPLLGSELTDILTRSTALSERRAGVAAPSEGGPPDPAVAEVLDGLPAEPPSGEREQAARTREEIEARAGAGRPRSDGSELSTLREALDARAAQARAALFEDAAPRGAQMEAIDQAILDMNDQLFTTLRDALEGGAPGEPLSRREMMGLGAEVFDILVTAEDRMLDVLTPDQRQRVREEATDPTSFFDPGLIDLLDGFQDRFGVAEDP